MTGCEPFPRPRESMGSVVVPHEGPSSASTGAATEPPDRIRKPSTFSLPQGNMGSAVTIHEGPSSALQQQLPSDQARTNVRKQSAVFPAPGEHGIRCGAP